MSDLYWIWAFISAFWTTVVVQCAKPVNWDQCSRVNDWLVPWVVDVIDMHKNGAYHSEKYILQQSNGLGGVDDRQPKPGGGAGAGT
nr:hypothetical protein [uncultured Mediterranean phage uvMED]